MQTIPVPAIAFHVLKIVVKLPCFPSEDFSPLNPKLRSMMKKSLVIKWSGIARKSESSQGP